MDKPWFTGDFHGSTRHGGHGLSSDPLDLPLDPGQKGVDGLSRIGYKFVNFIWQSEILG
jgi:hypothetical protein